MITAIRYLGVIIILSVQIICSSCANKETEKENINVKQDISRQNIRTKSLADREQVFDIQKTILQFRTSLFDGDDAVQNWIREDLADDTERWIAANPPIVHEITPYYVYIVGAVGTPDITAATLIAMSKVNRIVFSTEYKEVNQILLKLVEEVCESKNEDQKALKIYNGYRLEMQTHLLLGLISYTVSKD